MIRAGCVGDGGDERRVEFSAQRTTGVDQLAIGNTHGFESSLQRAFGPQRRPCRVDFTHLVEQPAHRVVELRRHTRKTGWLAQHVAHLLEQAERHAQGVSHR